MATNITAQYQLTFKDLASRGMLGVANSAKSLVGKLGAVTGAVAKIGGAFTAIAGGLVGSKLIQTQREFDVLNSSLLTAMGSTEAAAAKFKELNEFAAQTPYTLSQSVMGFVQLKNLGLDPSIKTMEAYGNMASAMGKDLSQMIEAVADASTFEFERLKEFGIKASQDAKKGIVEFTFQGQTKKIKRNAKAIQKYLLDVTKQFDGSMNNRMATLDGAFANFGQNFDNVLLKISQSGIGQAVASVLNKASAQLQIFFEFLDSEEGKQKIETIVNVIKTTWGSLKEFFGPIMSSIGNAVSYAVDYMQALKQAFDLGAESDSLADFPSSIQFIVKAVDKAIPIIVKAIDKAKEAFKTLGQWIDKTIQYGQAIKEWCIENKEVLIALGVGIGSVIAVYGTFIGVLRVFDTTVGAIVIGLSKLGGVLSKVGAIIGFITSPLGLVVVGVAAVIAAFTYFYRTNETFRNVVHGVWEFVKTAWNDIGNIISTTVTVTTTAIFTWWNFLKTGFTTTFTYVGNFVGSVFDNIKAAFYAVINFVIDGVNTMIRAINSVSSYVPGVGDSLQIREFEKLGVEHSLRSTQAAESKALVATSLVNMTMTVTGNVAGMNNFQANVSTDSYKSSGGNNSFVMKQR